jgi:multicomponent K+:H+ antiporter subunit A
MPSDALLLILMILPFAGSLAALLTPARHRDGIVFIAGGVALVGFVISCLCYPQVAGGEVIKRTLEWIPALGLTLSLRLDGLSWLFAIMVTGIGFLVVLYARYYMSPKDPLPRFFAYLLAFMGSMLGIVLAGNLVQMVIFWELTSLFSFLLVGYWYQNAAARDGARMSLIVTGSGGVALLLGVLVIGHIVGSYDLDAVLASGNLIRESALYLPALLLVLAGALTKSAQFPFHFWLPRAMAAPTPVSAYLHSATLVKAGIFLMVRLWPVMAGTDAWLWIVTLCGLSTLLIGAYTAIFQNDLKGLLANSTISHLGLITTLIGLGSPLALVAAIFHIANHATFKASLFMAAGIIDHEAGTRDIRRLSGLFRFMPFTATLAMVASAAMAGVPLLNGFLSKEMFFAEAADYNPVPFINVSVPVVAVLAGAFAVAYSLRFIHGVFFGPPPTDLDRVPHEPPPLMRRPIEVLVLICLVVGIVPGMTIGPFLHSAVVSVLGATTPYYSLSVWHGVNTALIMSVVALVGGTALYIWLQGYLARGNDEVPLLRHLIGQRLFERLLLRLMTRWARTLERMAGSRRLQVQLALIVAVAVLAVVLAIAGPGIGGFSFSTAGFDPALAILWIVGSACAIGAAIQAKYHRLVALMLMGGAGLATSVTFVWFSAPDLALTQLVVEIVTTVLLLLGLRWLPKRLEEAAIDQRITFGAHLRHYRDLLLAVGAGGGMALISYAVMTRPPVVDSIANYFLEKAYSEGGGTNVVNVMLVDFRGFDTMGEITVLGIVALTTFALLRRFRPAADSVDKPEQQLVQAQFEERDPAREEGSILDDYLHVPSVIMRWMFPVIIVFAAFLFLRGHDKPGGGFVAGITLSIGFVLQYLAGGIRWVEPRLRILPLYWIGIGLLLALLTGIGSLVFGMPFLTSAFQYAYVPLIGKVPMASALFFDLGVFILVVGATVLILVALAHQSIRRPKPPRRLPDAPTAKVENV